MCCADAPRNLRNVTFNLTDGFSYWVMLKWDAPATSVTVKNYRLQKKVNGAWENMFPLLEPNTLQQKVPNLLPGVTYEMRVALHYDSDKTAHSASLVFTMMADDGRCDYHTSNYRTSVLSILILVHMLLLLLQPVAAPGIFSWGGEVKPAPMASARSASIYGGLGAEPPVGSWGRAPGGGSGGEAPLKLKAFSLLGDPLIRQICIPLGILQSQKTTYIS